jgi:hypothetical protein
VSDLGFKVQDSEYSIWGSGCRDGGLRCRVQGSGSIMWIQGVGCSV